MSTTSKYYRRQRATVRQPVQRAKKPALPSALDMIYPSQFAAHRALCDCCCLLLPAATAASVCRAAMHLREVGCVLAVGRVLAVWRVACP